MRNSQRPRTRQQDDTQHFNSRVFPDFVLIFPLFDANNYSERPSGGCPERWCGDEMMIGSNKPRTLRQWQGGVTTPRGNTNGQRHDGQHLSAAKRGILDTKVINSWTRCFLGFEVGSPITDTKKRGKVHQHVLNNSFHWGPAIWFMSRVTQGVCEAFPHSFCSCFG